MRKIFASLMLFIFVFQIPYITRSEGFSESFFYYGDRDKNGKIDTFEIHFNQEIQGNIDFEKLILYSDAGGLASYKLDSIKGENIFSDFFIEGNILRIMIHEQDLQNISLNINHTTTSHLRIRNNSGIGIKSISGEEMKLSYTTSFSQYKNIAYKDFSFDEDVGEIPENEEEQDILIEDPEENVEDEIMENDQNGEENSSQDEDDIFEESIDEAESSQDEVQNESEHIGDDENIVEEEGEISQEDQEISPDFQAELHFQSPSYLLDKTAGLSEYECDRSYTDCRINFQLFVSEAFQEFKAPSNKYACEWDFGELSFDSESQKCNPNTVVFPVGKYSISYKVFLKQNPHIFIQHEFSLENKGYIAPIAKSISSYISSPANIFIHSPNIEIQSGINEENYCIKTDCQINLIYHPNDEQERCEWLFPGGSFSERTNTKCNPGYVKYPIGSYMVTLRVYQHNNPGNYKESTFHFVNSPGYVKEMPGENPPINTGEIFESIEDDVRIVLQGSLGKNKILDESTLICLTQTCSVNFTAEGGKKGVIYRWKLGKNIIFEGKNPSAIVYESGEYEIELSWFDNEQLLGQELFFVKVGAKMLSVKTQAEQEEILKKYPLKITKIFPNPVGVDSKEFIEITNNADTLLELESCVLDDTLGKGSKAYTFPSYQTLFPNQSKRWYYFDTQIQIGNTGFQELHLFCEGILVDSLSWNFGVPEGVVLYREWIEKGILNIKKDTKTSEFIISFLDGEKLSQKFSDFSDQSWNDVKRVMKAMESIPSLQDSDTKQLQKDFLLQYIYETFSQKISKQKKGIKISGNTLPNTHIVFQFLSQNDEQMLQHESFQTLSNDDGYYEKWFSSFSVGDFEVYSFLHISDENLVQIPKTKSLEVESEYLEYITPALKESGTEIIQAHITLQGKTAQNKTITSSKIICRDTQSCSVNFDGRKSTGKNISYFWDFGNGKTFSQANPAAYNFGVGNHIVSLTVTKAEVSHTAYFAVQVIPKPPKEVISKTVTTSTPPLSSSQTSIDGSISFPIMYHFLYSGLILLLFLVLSVLILRQKSIL